MKSSLKIVAGLLCAAILILSITGCPQDVVPDNNPTACSHTFGEYVSDNNATFSADGTKSRTCSVCGYKETVTDEGSKKIPAPVPDSFVLVEGGTVTGTNQYTGAIRDGRIVTLSSFYMSKYETTQSQYKSVMEGQKVTVKGTEYELKASPSYSVQGSTTYKVDSDKDHANYPVENVTWFDAVYYCNLLSEKDNLEQCYGITVKEVDLGHITKADITYDHSKIGYRLPTSAEWEYAARGGDSTAADWNYAFSGADNAPGKSYYSHTNAGLDSVGWYSYNNITGITGDSIVAYTEEGKGTHEVGQKAPNRLGIYDMSGNVSEWCYDWSGTGIAQETVTNPLGEDSGSYRVIRGGSWYDAAYKSSVFNLADASPKCRQWDYGFRVVRNAN